MEGLTLYIIIGIIALVIIYVLLTLNKLIKLNNKVKEAFATMDVYLKKRWDLIPNLVETVKGYAKHESETLENIIAARNNYAKLSTSEKLSSNEEISSSLTKLFALAESYPELKANENFLALQNDLKDTEDKITYARQFYNDSAMSFNNLVQMFPSNIVDVYTIPLYSNVII